VGFQPLEQLEKKFGLADLTASQETEASTAA
jgi:hypothetical protein